MVYKQNRMWFSEGDMVKRSLLVKPMNSMTLCVVLRPGVHAHVRGASVTTLRCDKALTQRPFHVWAG